MNSVLFIYNAYVVTENRDEPFIRFRRTRFLIIVCYLTQVVHIS